MSTGFTVDLDQLDQLVSGVHGLAGFVHDHLDELDHRIATLLDGSWESAAATAYHDAHTEWAGNAREFADGIATMGNAARLAHANYTDAITANTNLLREH